ESNGTPRLNKIARGILMKYCPFPATTRETLGQHPQYRELLERLNLQREQKLHHLQQIRKKLLLGSTPVPEELDAEIEYYTK
ncbi:MAG: cyclic nucleotide-binding domain-containing protein, partial [Clostridia bacterium]|nr:cyclic nucleotide-binding domain-containing protein [Clostridia bacterium]